MKAIDGGTFDVAIAQGRSAAWQALGNLDQAIAFETEVVLLQPDSADPLARLARLYRLHGWVDQANRTEERAAAILKKNSSPRSRRSSVDSG